MPIPIVYEDDWLLVVNKPSGMLSIPSPKKELPTLTGILNENLKKKNISYRLHPCHRLDKETSGLIIYAKGKSIQKKMMDIFKHKKIKKVYVAFIEKRLPKDTGVIRYPVEGQSAVTHYKVIEKRDNFSVVEVTPLTGRKNQIRLHFKTAGSAILGDTKFAFRRDFRLKAKKLCLHAKSLEFVHPQTKKTLSLAANLPAHMRELRLKY